MPTTTTADGDKVAALRLAHALHHQAALVTDPAFGAGQSFFDARDLVQVKYEMLRRVHVDGHSVSQAAHAFGFSRPSFYAAQRAWLAAGLAGLIPQRPGPRRASKLAPALMAFVDGCLHRDPTLRTRDLAARLAEQFGVQVHPRSIERALVRRGNPLLARLPRQFREEEPSP